LLSSLAGVDLREALGLARQELARLRARGNIEDLTSVLHAYAEMLIAAGDYAEAKPCLDECLASWRQLNVDWRVGEGAALALLDLGLLALLQGNLADVQIYCAQSMELSRQAGDLAYVGWLHLLIGRALRQQGNLVSAWHNCRRSLDLYTELGAIRWISWTLVELGQLVEARGQLARVARIMGAASVTRDPFLGFMPTERLLYERGMAAARERYAGTEYAAAWAEGEHMTLEQAVAYALQEGEADEPSIR
jgi:tetratricopeptide (TPR) repeat protein